MKKQVTRLELLAVVVIVGLLLVFFYLSPRMSPVQRVACYGGLLFAGGLLWRAASALEKALSKRRKSPPPV
jgi:hypothetical protein